jgi:hypothetical protein
MLPAVDDNQLLRELRVVVTAGAHLPDWQQRADEVPNCLHFARSRPNEAFRTTAARFLSLLNDSLISNSEAEDSESALLTPEEALGLRILFGTHPDYYEDRPMKRRKNAAEYLVRRPSNQSIQGDTFYRFHQDTWLRIAVECLRSSYGQAQPGSGFNYEVVSRRSIARVGEKHRIREVEVRNTARSCVNGMNFLRVFLHLPDTEGLDAFDIESIGDLAPPEIFRVDDGSFRLTFTPRQPLSVGEELEWGYVRRYRYKEGTPPLAEDELIVTSKNGGFSIDLTVVFDSQPATVNADRNQERAPVESGSTLVRSYLAA